MRHRSSDHQQPSGHHHEMGPDLSERYVRRYDRLARIALSQGYRRISHDLVRGVSQGATLVDVGTGPGRLLVDIASARTDLRVIGVDHSPEMVAQSRRNTTQFGDRVTVHQADVVDLPLASESVDLAVATLSLHHWSDPRAAGAELRRVLRPGGALVIYDFRHADVATLQTGFTLSDDDGPDEAPRRFPLTRLGFPALRRYRLHSRATGQREV